MNKSDNNIKTLFTQKPHVKTTELLGFLENIYPGTNEASLRWHIHKLKDQGIIKQLGRGLYSLNSKPGFDPSISTTLRKLYNETARNFPFINLCIWDSRWFNEFMLHQAFKHYLVVEVEKEAVESVFYRLTEKHKNIFFNPGQEIYDKYIASLDEATIIIPLISESPLRQSQKINIPSLEKLLVDCLTNDNLFRAQQNDLKYIFQTAFEKYDLNAGKMKRYAKRRNQGQKLEELMNKYSAKNSH
jgi:hypothetical protein